MPESTRAYVDASKMFDMLNSALLADEYAMSSIDVSYTLLLNSTVVKLCCATSANALLLYEY